MPTYKIRETRETIIEIADDPPSRPRVTAARIVAAFLALWPWFARLLRADEP